LDEPDTIPAHFLQAILGQNVAQTLCGSVGFVESVESLHGQDILIECDAVLGI